MLNHLVTVAMDEGHKMWHLITRLHDRREHPMLGHITHLSIMGVSFFLALHLGGIILMLVVLRCGHREVCLGSSSLRLLDGSCLHENIIM